MCGEWSINPIVPKLAGKMGWLGGLLIGATRPEPGSVFVRVEQLHADDLVAHAEEGVEHDGIEVRASLVLHDRRSSGRAETPSCRTDAS